jgi:hypothetical protein
MESPFNTYTKNKMNAALVRPRFNSEFNDLYINGSPGVNKDGLGETNEESAILSLGKFIPGKIYTFDYDPIYKDILSYYDRKPLIFVNNTFKAESTGNDIVTGVNLNFLPELARAQALDVFWQNFKADVQKSEDMAADNKINLSINKIIGFFKDWISVLKVYNGSGGLGYQYAYRNYAISQIRGIRYIEYNHWEMVPFLTPQFFNGSSVEEIHKMYWTQQAILNKKIPK